MPGLAAKLEALFGLGQQPMIRKRCYVRLQSLFDRGEEQAIAIIRECVETAKQKRNPGNWFASAVTRRLGEAGFPCSEHVAQVLAAKQSMIEKLASEMRSFPEPF